MKTLLTALVLLCTFPIASEDMGEIGFSWKTIPASFAVNTSQIFDDSLKVELYESVLYSDGNLFYLNHSSDKEIQILRFSLGSGEKQSFPFSEGKILGWTVYKKDLLVLVKNKFVFLDSNSLTKKKEIPSSIASNQFRDLIIHDNVLLSFIGKKVFSYDLNSGEKKLEREFPFDSVQRVLKVDDSTLLLYSSFWGNKMKRINVETLEFQSEVQLPTNHRSLFKLAVTENKRYLVADPITKNYSEWMDYGNKIIEVSKGLQISSSPPAARFSPIENFISYKLKITAKENTPESTVHFVLPKAKTYSQELTEERFSKSSEIKFDSFGNRILTLSIPALSKDQVFEHSPYEAKLTRYKIAFDLKDLDLELRNLEIPKDLASFTTNNSSLKFEEPGVITKRKEVIGEATKVADILNLTQSYVASIPYKAGAFQSAPFVIEKNNGGCTEHSYVTMAFLRSLGIPTRLVWNYLPTESSDILFFNHKFVEAWIPKFGWIPMEPLSSPNKVPGSTNARHVIFAGLEKTSLEDIAGGDRLFNLTRSDLGLAKKMTIRLDIMKTGVGEEFELSPVKMKTVPKLSGEELFVP